MAESQQEDFSKLSIEDKLAHKVWKARLMGYEEVTKLFKKIDDENSPEYGKYVGLVRKFPVESNAVAQEKALEATLAFTEYAAAAGKICSDVISGVVTKCLNARPKTKELGINICLMYIEVEKQDVVVEEVMKGFGNKQPKIVAASISVIRRAIEEFGARVFNVKALLKATPGVFEHSDKNVRAEAKLLAIELFKWVGAALKVSIDGKIKPVQMKELEEEFEKLPPGPPVPTRLLRSQQAVAQTTPSGGGAETGGQEGVVVAPQPEAVDPYDLLDPVNMLNKMPKDFYEKIADTKWKERKEALEAILPLAQSPKLEPGDYGDLIKVLRKLITKDSNVMVVALSGNVVTGLATGLRKKFSPYASACMSGIFDKFKEKKANVVTSLREASDAVYLTTSLGNIQDECVEALNNKNPSVKAETLLFLARCYCQCAPTMIPKPYLKTMCPLILQRLDDTNPQVRDAGMEVLGTLLKALGDRAMTAYLENVDKTKMAKITEFKDKVEMKVKAVPVSAQATAPAPAKAAPPKPDTESEPPKETAPPKKKPVKKKAAPKKTTGEESKSANKTEEPKSKEPPAKKAPPKASGGGGGASKGKSKGGAVGGVGEPPEVSEPNIANEELDDKAKEILPEGLLDQLAVTAWKERLAAHEQFMQFIEGLSPGNLQSLLFIKVLGKKPGWKDSNFQVMKCKFTIIQLLAQKSPSFGKKSFSVALPALVDKFADIKVKGQSADTLLMIAEKMTLNYTSLQVLKYAFDQKSPKVHSESLEWLCRGLREFGFLLNVKPHVDYIKKALSATNPAVRTAAINLLATLHMYLGPQLRMFFEDEKPALLQQIDSAFEKSSGETAPAPIRGPNVRTEEEAAEDEGGAGGDSGEGPKMSLADLMPKVDISGQIKADLIKELGDKNWKIRGEALQKIQDIIAQAKFVQPSLGELPGALKGRLGDSNKNLVMTTLSIIGTLAGAMGSSCSKFNKVFIPPVLGTLVDAKVQVRTAAITCLNAWTDEVPVNMLFEQDLVAGSLATENPNLRTELLGWLEEKLPACSKLPPETQSVIHPVLIALEDRSAEVRKKAQAVVPHLMAHVGYEAMVKAAGKLQPASKQQVKALLDKHRPAVVAKAPAAASETKSAQKKEDAATSPPKKASGASTKKAGGKVGAGKGRPKTGGEGKKKGEEEIEGAPLMLSPNGKEQRMKDEEKLKLLKWNFQPLPRPEHIDQLKDQMLTCVHLSVHKKIFHDDFKQQLSAIAILTDFISNPDHTPIAIGCCDLLLRWVTLKFFDTNTTINLKCLEFLHVLFKQLLTIDYCLSDYESGAFLPYLVIKVGDPKDPVRKEVRSLFRELCCIYQPAKIFPFVIDGLKSKNARQRTECLEILAELIQNNGMMVCQPSPQKTVPLIANQITDRDNTVRSAALNAMVFVHAYIGEGMYKFTSQLSEKEISLLEERIKRAKKPTLGVHQHEPINPASASSSGPSSRGPTPPVTRTPEPTSDVKSSKENVTQAEEKPEVQQLQQPSPPGGSGGESGASGVSPRSRLPKPTGPFRIDMNKYRPPQKRLAQPKVRKPDFSCYEGNDEVPVLPVSESVRNPSKPIRIPAAKGTATSAIPYIISQLDVSDFDSCMEAVSRLEVLITTPDHHKTLTPHVDRLLKSVLMQLRINFTTNLPRSVTPQNNRNVQELSRVLSRVLMKLFEQPSLACVATQPTLKALIRDTCGYLIDESLCVLEGIAQLNRVFNVLMAKVVDNSDKNVVLSALLEVMLETLDSNGKTTGLSDMAMKCLFRIIRQLSSVISSVNLDQLFLDLERFFEGYAKLNPSPTSEDKPYRTAKSILFHLTNILGLEVLDHLSLINDHSTSHVASYLNKLIEKKRRSGDLPTGPTTIAKPPTAVTGSQKENSEDSEGDTQGIKEVSPLMRGVVPTDHAVLVSTLIERLRDRSTRRQAIIDLYDLKENRPDIDLAGCLRTGSEGFQKYVKKGLRLVKEMRETGRDLLGGSYEPDGLRKAKSDLQAVRERAGQLMNIDWDEVDRRNNGVNGAQRGPNTEDFANSAPKKQEKFEQPVLRPPLNERPSDSDSTDKQQPLLDSTIKASPSAESSSRLEELRKRLDRLKAGSSAGGPS